MTVDRRAPLPLTIPTTVKCNLCGLVLTALGLESAGNRFYVNHGGMDPVTLELDRELDFCPNNGKRWVIEFQQPWIYEMDPVTGEIDTFGGRVV